MTESNLDSPQSPGPPAILPTAGDEVVYMRFQLHEPVPFYWLTAGDTQGY